MEESLQTRPNLLYLDQQTSQLIMSDRGFIIRNQNNIHFITFAVVQWVDVFTRREYADIVIKSLKFCQNKKGLKIYA
jgi:putative transposase